MEPYRPSSAPDRLRDFFRQYPSLAVATRDDRRVVELSRCAAVELAPDGRVYFALPLPDGKRALANIDATGVVALSAARPSDYVTVQLKGTDAKRVEWPGMRAAAEAHRVGFGAIMVSVGMSNSVPDLLWSAEHVAVAFTPSHVFDQTPGPAAGLRIGP